MLLKVLIILLAPGLLIVWLLNKRPASKRQRAIVDGIIIAVLTCAIATMLYISSP